jgi:hypothetical protein
MREVQYLVYTDCSTVYRIRPNPDASPEEDAGVEISWTEDGDEFHGHMFIAPEAVVDVAEAIKDLKERSR